MSEESKTMAIIWVVVTIVLYIICSFISWDIEIDEWSGFIRGLFIVLVVASGIGAIILSNQDN